MTFRFTAGRHAFFRRYWLQRIGVMAVRERVPQGWIGHGAGHTTYVLHSGSHNSNTEPAQSNTDLAQPPPPLSMRSAGVTGPAWPLSAPTRGRRCHHVWQPTATYSDSIILNKERSVGRSGSTAVANTRLRLRLRFRVLEFRRLGGGLRHRSHDFHQIDHAGHRNAWANLGLLGNLTPVMSRSEWRGAAPVPAASWP